MKKKNLVDLFCGKISVSRLSSIMKKFMFVGCQTPVTEDKSRNHATAEQYINRAVNEYKANVVALPECWNCPYANSAFPQFAEDLSQIGNQSINKYTSK